MCGIVGYIGTKKASPILINGLIRLEYRGYDSAGISTIENDGLSVHDRNNRPFPKVLMETGPALILSGVSSGPIRLPGSLHLLPSKMLYFASPSEPTNAARKRPPPIGAI